MNPSTPRTNPAGHEWCIASAGYEATVTQVGATLRSLTYEGTPLVAGFEETSRSVDGRGQVLAPWPNRVAGGRYSFEGREHQLDLSEPARGHALHGLVRWLPWVPEEESPTAVTMATRLFPQQGWEWVLDLRVRYALGAEGLTVAITARNAGAGRAPFGYGAHPYLTAGEREVDELILTVPAQRWCQVDTERMLPVNGTAAASLHSAAGGAMDFRSASQIGERALDTAYTDMPEQWAVRVEGEWAVELWADAATFPWLQVFTGDVLPEGRHRRSGLAVEPMTCPPNALATGEDLVVLDPEECWTGTWGVRAG